MTRDPLSDSELLEGLPDRPELMGVLYERHALPVFRYLARRASVMVFIASGPADSAPKVRGFSTSTFTMPSVVGDTAHQALLALTKAGIGSVEITGSSSAASGGVVAAQSPAADTTVAPGTPATISVKS